jgi:acetate kinase
VIVLALNCGSSSLKFQVFASDPGAPAAGARRLARGLVERIGDGATLMFQAEGSSATREREPVPDHEAAVRRVLGWLAAGGASEHGGALRVDAVGHRVVHGGARFTEPVLIGADVLEAIEALEALAPLHNAPSLAGMRAARAAAWVISRYLALVRATLAPAARLAERVGDAVLIVAQRR